MPNESQPAPHISDTMTAEVAGLTQSIRELFASLDDLAAVKARLGATLQAYENRRRR